MPRQRSSAASGTATGKKRGRPSGRRFINDNSFDPDAQLDFFNQLDDYRRQLAAASDRIKEHKNDAQRRGGDKWMLELCDRFRKKVERGTLAAGEVLPALDRLRGYCWHTIPGIQDAAEDGESETDQIVAAARSGHGAGAFPIQ